MKRKVVLQGGVALTVVIPASWARKNNIQKGDEVKLVEDNEFLKVYPLGNDNKLENKIVEIDYDPLLFESHLNSLYIKGFHEILVTFKEISQLEEIERISTSLMGLMVVEHNPDRCLIKCVGDINKKEFGSVFKRNFLVVLMCANCLLELNKKNIKEIEGKFSLLEKTNNRLTIYSKRYLLNKASKLKSAYHYAFVNDLKRITHHYLNIINFLINNKSDVRKSEVINEVNFLLKNLYKFSIGKETVGIANFYDWIKKTKENITKNDEKLDPNLVNNLNHIVDLVYEMFLYINGYTN